jgi:hypothetical protein
MQDPLEDNLPNKTQVPIAQFRPDIEHGEYVNPFTAKKVLIITASGRARGRPRKPPKEKIVIEKTPRRLRSRSNQTVLTTLDDGDDPLSQYPSLTPQSPTKQPNERHASYPNSVL